MFGKLVKHELRSGIRTFLPIWCGMFVLAILTGVCVRLSDSRMSASRTFGSIALVLSVMLMFSLFIAAVVFTIIYIIRRFGKGLLGNEGYLMFTLPVTTEQLLGSRVLTAFLYILFSILVALLSAVTLFLIADASAVLVFFERLLNGFYRITQGEGIYVLIVVESVVILLLLLCEAFMRIQLSISLGHLFKKGRGGFAVLMYIAVTWTLEIILTIIATSVRFYQWVGSLLESGSVGLIAALLGIIAGVILILCAIYYVIIDLILKNRLNLN